MFIVYLYKSQCFLTLYLPVWASRWVFHSTRGVRTVLSYVSPWKKRKYIVLLLLQDHILYLHFHITWLLDQDSSLVMTC